MLGIRDILSRYALTFVAAAIPVATLLILFEVHTAVIRRGLTFVGMRPDVPVILSTIDACRNESPRVQAFVASGTDPELETDDRCLEEHSIIVAKRPDKTVGLYLNGELVALNKSQSRIVRFDSIRVEQAANAVQVVSEDQLSWRPLGTRPSSARWTRSGLNFDQPSSFWDRPSSRPLGLIGLEGPQAPTELAELGVWQSRDGNHYALVSGTPVSLLPDTVFGEDVLRSRLEYTDTAGLAVVELAPEAAQGKPEPPFYRRLTIEREPDGALNVGADTCLPPGHPLQRRVLPAREDAAPGVLPMSGPLFVSQFFNVQIGRWAQGGLADTSSYGAVRFTTDGTANCRPVSVSFRMADAGFSLLQEAISSFPSLPNDELVLSGFGDDLDQHGRAASSAASGALRWIGGDGSTRARGVSLNYYQGRSIAAQTRSSDDRVFSQYRQLFEALPDRFQYFLYLFAPILPAILILLVARNTVRPADADLRVFHMAVRGLTALVFFGVAWALVPFAQWFAYWLMDIARLDQSVRDLATNIYSRNNESVPAAILVVLLALVLLRQGTVSKQTSTKLSAVFGYTASLAATLAVIGLGMGALRAQFLLTNELLAEELAKEAAALPLMEWLDNADFVGTVSPLWMTLLWALIVALLATITVAWVFRRLSGPLGMGAVFGATSTVFLMALVPTLLDTAALALAAASYPDYQATEVRQFVLDASDFAARIAPRAILFLVTFLAFHRIVTFARTHVDTKARLSVRSLSALLALVVTLSLAGQTAAGQQTLNADLILLTGLAHSYAPLIALVFGFFLLDAMRPKGDSTPNIVGPSPVPDPFRLPDSAYLICSAAFASYVATWSLNPVTLLPVVFVGWLMFDWFILSPETTEHAVRQDTLATRYIAFLRAGHLAHQVRKAARTGFAKGEVSLREFRLRNTQADNHARDFAETLTTEEQGAAKRLIFGRGPANSPMANGIRGALAGLTTALVLQALVPFNTTFGEVGLEGGWLTLANLVLTEASYDIVRGAGGAPEVWLAISRIVNSLTLWVTAGFLFGFVFHRIRGDDGFIKAARFSLGVVAAVLVAQAIAGGSGSLELVSQVLPLTVFLLLTGTLFFDGASLRAQNLGYGDLIEIYGFQTSLGYASFAGALAGLAPLLNLLGILG